MQCKGGFEYPEGENESTTAEAQKLAVSLKNYSNRSRLLFQMPEVGYDLATPFILAPITLSHVPTKLSFPLLLIYAPMFLLCLFWFLCLGRSYKPYLAWRQKVNSCSSISMCWTNNVPFVWVLQVCDTFGHLIHIIVLALFIPPIRLKSGIWFLNNTLSMCL